MEDVLWGVGGGGCGGGASELMIDNWLCRCRLPWFPHEVKGVLETPRCDFVFFC